MLTTIIILLTIILLSLLSIGVLLFIMLNQILDLIAGLSASVNTLIAQGQNSIPPAGGQQIVDGLTALKATVDAAIVPPAP